LYDYGIRSSRTSLLGRGVGGNVTVLGHVTWSRALAWASIGGVERQNPSICTNRSFVLALNSRN
jgi:hypothetical protein